MARRARLARVSLLAGVTAHPLLYHLYCPAFAEGASSLRIGAGAWPGNGNEVHRSGCRNDGSRKACLERDSNRSRIGYRRQSRAKLENGSNGERYSHPLQFIIPGYSSGKLVVRAIVEEPGRFRPPKSRFAVPDGLRNEQRRQSLRARDSAMQDS